MLAVLLKSIGVETAGDKGESIILSCDAVRVRRSHELRLVIPGPASQAAALPDHDEKLVSLMVDAHAARRLVLSQPEKTISRIAAESQRCRTRLARMVALSCLAPTSLLPSSRES